MRVAPMKPLAATERAAFLWYFLWPHKESTNCNGFFKPTSTLTVQQYPFQRDVLSLLKTTSMLVVQQ